MFVASLCYWWWKVISSICCHWSMIAYHQHSFYFLLFCLFVRLLELLSIKWEFITIYVPLLPFLYWFVLESQCFSMNKVWNTSPFVQLPWEKSCRFLILELSRTEHSQCARTARCWNGKQQTCSNIRWYQRRISGSGGRLKATWSTDEAWPSTSDTGRKKLPLTGRHLGQNHAQTGLGQMDG